MTDLREVLFAARDDELAALCMRHREEIVAEFEAWLVVPAAVRDDREALERLFRGISRVAGQLHELGEDRPLARLHSEGTPIDTWHGQLTQVDDLLEAAHWERAVAVLEECLATLEQASGAFVDDLLAKARGKMAVAFLGLKDYDSARAFTIAAVESCTATGDLDGIRTYRENLDVLDAIVGDESLVGVRNEVVAAQKLSDRGDYALSVETLTRLVERDVEQYQAKIRGLLGLNLFHLGDLDQARELTSAAVAISRAQDDLHGVMMYTENLRVIDERRQSQVKRGWPRLPRSWRRRS
jgi:tetratricopeptide (TPR) repeat protein